MEWDWNFIATVIFGTIALIFQFYKSSLDHRIKALNTITFIAILISLIFAASGIRDFYISTGPISRIDILNLIQNSIIGTLMLLWLGSKLWKGYISKAYPDAGK
ncbi:MAG TPA: hypothetical protein DD666_00645 [Advenella kashmirensis]|uniref:Uncharacterized protein n=1 Tax=Advenella kashmirensis TaxID=310575 RepID=A0A356LA89_9BURK|nr:hypothetical protein [Advenella kashmirensis]